VHVIGGLPIYTTYFTGYLIKLLEKIDWESYRNVLDQWEKERILKKQW